MNNLKNNPKTSILGVIFIILGFLLLFIETKIEFPWYFIFILFVFGVLLLLAKDRLINVLIEIFKNISDKVK